MSLKIINFNLQTWYNILCKFSFQLTNFVSAPEIRKNQVLSIIKIPFTEMPGEIENFRGYKFLTSVVNVEDSLRVIYSNL